MTHLQNFDPVWCGKIMKVRAVGSVAAVFSAIVIMLAYDRPGGWKIPGEAGSSLWGLIFLIVGPAAIIAVYQSLHWDAMAQRIIQGRPKLGDQFPPTPYDRISSYYEPDPATFEYNKLFLVLGIGWVLFCATPLFFIAGSFLAQN